MDLIYLMGGKGTRTKLGYPKQFFRLNGKYLFLFGLDIFCSVEEIENIIIPIQTDKQSFIKEILKKHSLDCKKNFKFCKNGETRQLSCYNGLLQAKSDTILISEAVRPFITKPFVNEIIKNKHNNVTPIDKMKSSVVDFQNRYYDRDSIGTVQMPQKFDREKLLQAHNLEMEKESFNNTDDSVVFLKYFSELILVHGLEQNIKITTSLDIAIAKTIYKQCKNATIGDE